MLEKVSLAARLAAQYHRPNLFEILLALEQRINRAIEGYLFRVTSVSSNYSATVQDSVILVNTTGGARTITLPRADACKEKRFTVKKADNSANAVTVQSSSGTIDDAASYSISSAYEAADFVSDGTEFWVV